MPEDLSVQPEVDENKTANEQEIRNRKQSKKTSRNERYGEDDTTSKKYGFHVAPLNTPLENRLQTLGIMWHCMSIPFFVSLFLIVLSLGWVAWLTIILPYFIWWYGFDLHTPTNGKAAYRPKDWMRNLIVWQWFVSYFPIEVHKSCDLAPTYTEVMVEDNTEPDDEEDLISEDTRTNIDKLFMKLGLSKRLNDFDSTKIVDSQADKKKGNFKITKVSHGPRYIFGYHPHGVISMGVMGTFATNIIRNEPFEPPLKCLRAFFYDPANKEKLLPGIGNVFPLTLTTQFTLPFYRDYLMSLGLTSASGKNIKRIINNGDNSVCLVVGGAQESLLNDVVASHSRRGKKYKEDSKNEKAARSEEDEGKSDELPTADQKNSSKEIRLVLNKRKGFIKIAIELGNISLVPTFGFGEADIYRVKQPKPGSIGSKFQKWMKSTFQFTVPFFSARGVFLYDFGLLPYRNPINICMGRPIHVPKEALQDYLKEHPAFEKDHLDTKKATGKIQVPPELVDHYHKLYVDELKRVFEENKGNYGYDDVELKIIE